MSFSDVVIQGFLVLRQALVLAFAGFARPEVPSLLSPLGGPLGGGQPIARVRRPMALGYNEAKALFADDGPEVLTPTCAGGPRRKKRGDDRSADRAGLKRGLPL